LCGLSLINLGLPCCVCCLLQVSFVNSICTNWGGTHVNYVVDQVSK
jgi:hypothetical protein